MMSTVHARRLPVTASRAFDVLRTITDDAFIDEAGRRLIRHLPDGAREEWEVRSDRLACQVVQRSTPPQHPVRRLRWAVLGRWSHAAAVRDRLNQLSSDAVASNTLSAE